jgi:hypothetical protein
LRVRRYDPAQQVKDNEAEGAHNTLDLWAEDPKEEHVAEDMHPPFMHEHRGEDGHQPPACHDIGRDHGPMVDKGIPPYQFEKKHKKVDKNNGKRPHREMDQPAGGVTEGNHS